MSEAQRLRMEGVSKRFGATVALDDVALEVDAGEVHALIGENGAGKSTLMKVLSGAYRADAGRLRLDGEPYAPRSPADGRRAGIGMIYQELSLAPHLSVMDNLVLGDEPTRGLLLDRRAVRRRAVDALRQVGHPEIPLERPAGALSVAEQQLVEIARSVALGCRVLVLDEPTSSLGQSDTRRLFDLLRRLRAEGQAIVYISHVLEEVFEISDRYTVLRDGRAVGGGATEGAGVDAIVTLMVGREVRDLYPRSERAPGEVVLDVPGVLALRRGEVAGIAGLIGAGRTELLRSVFAARRWRHGVGMVSEDRQGEGLALNLAVADNLALPRLPPLLSDRRLGDAVRPWIDRLMIRCTSPRQPADALSGGNQQKVALARLLHADVDVLLLDEPTRGIDVGSKAQIYRLIDDLAVRGKAVLMVSSYLPELLGICDRVAVMVRGTLGPWHAAREVDEHDLMREAVS